VKFSKRIFDKKMTVVLLAGIGITLCTLAMSTLEHFTLQGIRYLGLFLVAFAVYLLAVICLYNRRETNWRSHLILIFTLALLQRVPLWGGEPTLSTDVWRYLWDGRLMTSGVNPYAEPVNSTALDRHDTHLRARVDHDWMASPYPPAAQLVFAGTYSLVPESPTAMQIVFTGFDLATGVVLVLFLQRLKIPTGRVVLYLWNPLIIVEFAHGAHVDSLMTLLVVLALYLFYTDRQTESAIPLALATLTKFIPVLLVPVFLRRWAGRGALLYLAIVFLGLLPFLGAGLGLVGELDGRGIFGAIRIYNAYWKTNDGLFYWLSRAVEPLSQDPVALARVISLILLGLMGLWVFNVARRKALDSDPVHSVNQSALLVSAYLLLSPVVFPWYLTLLLALLPLIQLQKSRPAILFSIGWLYFSAAVNLSYLFYLDPASPRELEWVRSVEYIPLWMALLGALILLGRARFMPNRAPHPASNAD
jgi:alpha-1,6-mannosyltransferase